MSGDENGDDIVSSVCRHLWVRRDPSSMRQVLNLVSLLEPAAAQSEMEAQRRVSPAQFKQQQMIK